MSVCLAQASQSPENSGTESSISFFRPGKVLIKYKLWKCHEILISPNIIIRL